MGGFAGSHHQAVARLEERGQARLVCTCDPNAAGFAVEREAWRLTPRGVRMFADYAAMLEECHQFLDMVVIPTPLHLHARMHAAVTAHGLSAYVEKPPTLDHVELERMISADARVRKASVVGFNFIIEKLRLSVKERLLAGEFGAVRGATLGALWPRPASYFARNDWAGRLLAPDGSIVLDSCFGNAMAHFVHNLLFWTGTQGVFSWARLERVRAELYRAHAIEGADTFFVEADAAEGVTLRFALSHACAGPSSHCETVCCEQAVIRYVVGRHIEIQWRDGHIEKSQLEQSDPLLENHLDYLRYLRGESARPATTLADSRPFVILNDLAHVSSGRIAPVPAAQVGSRRDEREQQEYLHVAGMAAACENFLTRGTWPGASGWEREPGELVAAADLPRFHGTVRSMAGK
jgi:predicted dehydrogenase